MSVAAFAESTTRLPAKSRERWRGVAGFVGASFPERLAGGATVCEHGRPGSLPAGDHDRATKDKRRTTHAPREVVELMLLERVARPDALAVCRVEALQNTGRTDGIHAPIEHRWRAARTLAALPLEEAHIVGM